MTNRQLISEIRNDLQSISPDVWIPGAYILSKSRGFAALFIKREADDKRLFRFSDLYTVIKCLKMEEKDLIDCCDINIPNCKTVMVSKQPLPEVYSTRFGYLLNVSSVDYDKRYIPITPEGFKNIQSREFKDLSNRYFWFENQHVVSPVINDVTPSVLTVRGVFPDKAAALKLNSCGDAVGCLRVLDQEFVAPKHLLQEIKDATTKDLKSSFKQIVPDELTNKNSLEKTNPSK